MRKTIAAKFFHLMLVAFTPGQSLCEVDVNVRLTVSESYKNCSDSDVGVGGGHFGRSMLMPLRLNVVLKTHIITYHHISSTLAPKRSNITSPQLQIEQHIPTNPE